MLAGTAAVLCLGTAAMADPAAMPGMGASLAANPNPFSANAGLLGTIYMDGAFAGLTFWQSNATPGDRDTRFDLTNAQVFIQNTDSWLLFYVQAGAYSLPSLGTPYIKGDEMPDKTYGVVPQAFVKVAPTETFSIEAGKLPTLIGDEYTFTFQNLNIERGLLWNQEPAISRGVQANYTAGPLTVAVSWNDGFYSNVYNWISGLAAYTIDNANSLTFIGGGNLGRTTHSIFATPLAQNNGDIFNLIYTHISGSWTISPYMQYGHVPPDLSIGIARGASTYGAAVLVNYAFNNEWKLAGRMECIRAAGNIAAGTPNLLYGSDSRAWSLTVTPTYQRGILFARAEASVVVIARGQAGQLLGGTLGKQSQARLMFETGVLF